MKLHKYYRNAVIYPSVFVLFFSIINSIFANYQSNGQSDKSAITTSIIGSLIFCLVMCGLSQPIYLNKYKKIRSNLVWNVLSWFLLPIIYLVIIYVYEIKIRVKYYFGFGNDFIHLLIMTIPFVIGLSLTFIKYRQKITNVDRERIL